MRHLAQSWEATALARRSLGVVGWLAVGICLGLLAGWRTAPAKLTLVTEAAPTYLVRAVLDGDTLEIEDGAGIRTRVRLRRVDAPELSEPGGPEARDALERRLHGRRVRVTPYARDAYGRLVAEVNLEPLPGG